MSDSGGCSDGASASRLHELRRVGGGAAVVDAPTIAVAVAEDFRATLWLPMPDRRGRVPLASGLGQRAPLSHEHDESAALDVLRRRRGQFATAQVLCADGLVELRRAQVR